MPLADLDGEAPGYIVGADGPWNDPNWNRRPLPMRPGQAVRPMLPVRPGTGSGRPMAPVRPPQPPMQSALIQAILAELLGGGMGGHAGPVPPGFVGSR
jgi:hypothetical protein